MYKKNIDIFDDHYHHHHHFHKDDTPPNKPSLSDLAVYYNDALYLYKNMENKYNSLYLCIMYKIYVTTMLYMYLLLFDDYYGPKNNKETLTNDIILMKGTYWIMITLLAHILGVFFLWSCRKALKLP